MNELQAAADNPVLGHKPGTTGASVGALLRKAREDQGLQIAMLALQLKVPVNRLEALEADQYEVFPDTVLVRALAGSVSRALKVDAEMVLAALPPSLAPVIKSDQTGLNTVFNVAHHSLGRTLQSVLGKPLGIAILLLLLGIFAIVFFPPVLPFETSGMVPAAETSQTPTALPQVLPSKAEVITGPIAARSPKA